MPDPFDPFSADQVQAAVEREASETSESIRDLAARGLTDSEIATRLGLAVEVVRSHPDVLAAWNDAHDERVMRALYEAAVGSETWSDKMDRDGEIRRLVSKLPPDPKAALDWLKARRRADWGIDAIPIPPPLTISVQFVTPQGTQQGERLPVIDVTPIHQGVPAMPLDDPPSLVAVRSSNSEI